MAFGLITMRLARTLIPLLLLVLTLPAQQAVNPRDRYERFVAIVPMIGAGTPQDPRRPLHTPANEAQLQQHNRRQAKMLAFSYIVSDDGQYALVEFVATDRAAFAELIADPTIKKFEKGRAKREDIEREFRRYRRQFNLSDFGASVQSENCSCC